MTISEMLTRNARLYPDEIALIERNSKEGTRRQITWRQFDEKANRLANALIERGIQKGDKVLHLMFNSIEWLVVYFGIVRTGHGSSHSIIDILVKIFSTALMYPKLKC